mmetsp:Transcript_40059/g.87488  ORF Transcript_40059/g.87488 Transcript_40059/m.87488 type:complete len:281 (-) Transcript_40059:604-1446(-)
MQEVAKGRDCGGVERGGDAGVQDGDVVVTLTVEDVASVQVPMHEVVADHHLHIHVVKHPRQLALQCPLLLQHGGNRLGRGCAERLAAGFLDIVEVFENVRDHLSLGPGLDEDLLGGVGWRHFREPNAALTLEVPSELLQVMRLPCEVHLCLYDLVELTTVERHGHVKELLRQVYNLPQDGEVHEGAVSNAWMANLHRYVSQLAAWTIQRKFRAQQAAVDLAHGAASHRLLLKLIEELVDFEPELLPKSALGDLQGVRRGLRPELGKNLDDVWRKHVWPHR